MKKNTILLLSILSLFLLVACSEGNSQKTTPESDDMSAPELSPIDEATSNNIELNNIFYNPTIEYGEPSVLISNQEPLLAYVSYPYIGNSFDTLISSWANNLYQDSYNYIVENQANDSDLIGELNVHFDSYLINAKYAGIVEFGSFSYTRLAHPIDIIKTFNLSIYDERFLENTDILDFSQAPKILTLLESKIAEQSSYFNEVQPIAEIDTSWLDNIVLGSDGIIVILERAKYLPAYMGTFTITLPYDELGTALKLNFDPSVFPSNDPEYSIEDSILSNIPKASDEVDPTKPMVALTFDDGPSSYTSQLLDILEKHNARATFFVLGNLVSGRSDVVARAAKLGNEIHGHSWEHKNLTKLSDDDIKKELLDTSAAIEDATGVPSKLYRPPYGAVNDTVKSISSELGFAIINWSVDPEDWKNRDANAVYTSIMSAINDRAIILSHDLYASTIEAYERLIPKLIEDGYQLVTVSELLIYANGSIEPGIVYFNGK